MRAAIFAVCGALAGCEIRDPRFAEQPLVAPGTTGIAILHDARVSTLTLRDPRGRVVDHRYDRYFSRHDVDALRRPTHFAGRRVFWSSRPMRTDVVTVFTLPPGRYELVGYGDSVLVDDAARPAGGGARLAAPLLIDVPVQGVAVLGALRCGDAECTLDDSSAARRRTRDLVAWELTQPHAAADRALWMSWLPAIDDALRSAGPQGSALR